MGREEPWCELDRDRERQTRRTRARAQEIEMRDDTRVMIKCGNDTIPRQPLDTITILL